jgi:hypothetical protein
MTHVGIERLTAGDDQHDRTENEDAVPVMCGEKAHGMNRTYGLEHRRMTNDLPNAEDGDREKPQP